MGESYIWLGVYGQDIVAPLKLTCSACLCISLMTMGHVMIAYFLLTLPL